MDSVACLNWFLFVCNPQDLTFVGVEFHEVLLFPCLQCVEVFLEDEGVLFCFDGAVQEAVVSEQPDASVF